ncbi:MAG: hypothetical protein GX234_01650 [Clostridiales bacterium]|nr:hypothetical protein [Clostridiales bacterium]
MKVLVVTFPGFGYLQDRPLFYYAKKLAKQFGFDVLDLKYGAICEGESVRERAERSLPGAVEDAEKQIEQVLLDAGKENQSYDRIICISKSFGTLVAGNIWEKLSAFFRVSQVFLTPLPETYTMFARGKSCIMATGTADPFMTKEGLRMMEQDEKIELMIFPGANHSLENPEDTCESVRNLQRIVERYEDLFLRFCNVR